MEPNNKSIQFIDSSYKELIRIPDGGSIKVIYPPDNLSDIAVRECKYSVRKIRNRNIIILLVKKIKT